MPPENVSLPAPNVSFFTPIQDPPAGTAIVPQPDGKPIPKLFQPLKIRGLELHNRIFVAPMCTYSAKDGVLQPWHTAHLGGILMRGPGLTFIEATAVLPEGRITPEDTGIWSDEHIDPLSRIAELAHSQGQKIGIQIAHAGRKASTTPPWLPGDMLRSEEAGGWPDDIWGPSPLSFFSPMLPVPKELTKEQIARIVKAFADAAVRAVKAGIDVIEIHNAHGYLLQSFLSPISNQRTDEYGGSFENRIRLTLEVVDAVRAIIPEDMPLFLRISATEWFEESEDPSWKSADTCRLAPILYEHGVDFLDISSGGNSVHSKIQPGPAYQARFSEDVKRSLPEGHGLLVGAVGSISDGSIAQGVIDKGIDAVFVGRLFLKNPGLVWTYAEDLGVAIHQCRQLEWGFAGKYIRFLGKAKY